MGNIEDHLSGPNAQFLRKTFMVRKLWQIMDPYLAFNGMFPATGINARSVITTKEQYSDDSDPKKVWPARLTESSDWPNVSISPITQESAMLQKYGLQMKVGEDVLKISEGMGEINKALNRIGFWLAQFMNTRFSTTTIAECTNLAGNWTPTTLWSNTDTATPIQDLVKFKRCMRRTDRPYNCTDIYINTADYNDLELFLIDVNADLAKRQMIGQTTVGEDSVYIPAIRANVHRIDEGISESGILGLDSRNPVGTYYYYNDPRYGTKSISYPTNDGTRTVPGFGLNTYQYFEDSSHEIVTQFWFDGIFVVEDAYGAIYDTGI